MHLSKLPALRLIPSALASVWRRVRPLLTSLALDAFRDRDTLALAEKAVERAAGLDLDGDGKHDHAVAELKAELATIGKRYSKAALAILVEGVYQSLTAKGAIE